jgi:hypothetical protein
MFWLDGEQFIVAFQQMMNCLMAESVVPSFPPNCGSLRYSPRQNWGTPISFAKNFHRTKMHIFFRRPYVLNTSNTALPSPRRIPPSRRYDSHTTISSLMLSDNPSFDNKSCRRDGCCSFACTTFVPELPRHTYRCILRW